MARRLTLAVERFPIAGAFTISRGSRTEIAVVVATITDANGRRARRVRALSALRRERRERQRR